MSTMMRIFLSAFILFLYSNAVFAQAGASGTGLDALQMLTNLSNSYPALWRLITAICYVSGIALMLRAVYQLKAYGELRTMMSTQTSLKVPIVMMVAAVVLMFIPTAFQVVLKTGFQYTSPLSYNQATTSISPIAMKAIVGLVQIIGVISFIRGWMHLVGNAQQPGGQHSFGRAMTHIVGGVLAINIVGVVNIIWNSFGFASPFS